jgi:small subunit ribosomal protein S14
MAKRSVVNREARRRKLIAKYAERREALKHVIRNADTTYEEREDAQWKLNALPRNSCPVRLQNRCRLTGRPHAYYRKFGLGRNKLREAAMSGDIPGLVKASW